MPVYVGGLELAWQMTVFRLDGLGLHALLHFAKLT